MSEEDTIQLTDEESVVVLKALRNNPFNHLKKLVFGETEVHIAFNDATLEDVTLPREEVLPWKDKEWQAFFEKHEPLL